MIRIISIIFSIIFIIHFSSETKAEDRLHLRWVRSKPTIDSISIEGNQHFSDGEIRSKMYSRVSTLWRSIRKDRRTKVQRESYGRDTLEIKFLYLSNGFLGVKIDEQFEALPDSSALIRVTVHEGRQFNYGDKKVSGNVPGEFIHHCTKLTNKLKQGKPIDHFAVRSLIFEMKTHFANNGYPYANVIYTIDTNQTTNQAPLFFHIESDSLVHFGNVEIQGIVDYDKKVASRELKIKSDNVYRRKDVLDSQRRLFESGYFSTVSLRQSPNSPDRLKPDFLLRVRERKARYINFRTGAGQSTVRDLLWDISAGFGKRNFLGSRRYEISADYSFSVGEDSRLITHRYRLRYTEPWFMGIRMPLSFTFELEPRIKDPVNEFDKRSWSVGATTRKRFGEKIRTSLGFEVQFVKISGVPEEQIDELKALTDNNARRKIFGSFIRDSRDNLFIPSRGVLFEFFGDVYGGFLGGDENFFKIQSSWSRYERIWPGWIMATRLMGNWTEAFGESKEVPLDETIYLGGANTVRSFNENELGRILEGDLPLGPKYTLVLNQEFRWKTVQVFNVIPLLNNLMRSFPLWQSVFIDVGNGFRRSEDIRIDNFAYVYGTGIQVITPAGPIRIDYARRVKSEKFDFDERWHFTILYAF